MGFQIGYSLLYKNPNIPDFFLNLLLAFIPSNISLVLALEAAASYFTLASNLPISSFNAT